MNTGFLFDFFGQFIHQPRSILFLAILKHLWEEIFGLWTWHVLPSFLFSSLSFSLSFITGYNVELSSWGEPVLDCVVLLISLVLTEILLEDFFGTHMTLLVHLLLGRISFQESFYHLVGQLVFFKYFVGCGNRRFVWDIRMFAMFFFLVLVTSVLSSKIVYRSSCDLKTSFSRTVAAVLLSWSVWSSNIFFFQVHVHSLQPILCLSFPENSTSFTLQIGLSLLSYLAGSYIIQLIEAVKLFPLTKMQPNHLHRE
eukprot:TRINITY_DN22373_c0_g1_i2.p1 TRINITY_DN22373_c0_g1~~TRINITY_DN22373_c0_g1_i2.p1  ORF type:complete len:254 (+),score=24.90 TRINITY_DN22373_c0_g1_i2:428-1189(+)